MRNKPASRSSVVCNIVESHRDALASTGLRRDLIGAHRNLLPGRNALPRKNPSSHSDEQFALFVEKMTSGGEKIDQAQFEEMVRGLVRVDSEASRTTAASANAASHVDALKGRARKCAARAPDFLPLIGQLVLQWADSQGLLMQLLALMLEADVPTATVIFSTLNTTQHRLALIRRLAPLKVGDRQALNELNRILGDFDDACRLRDELLHATYLVDVQENPFRPNQAARMTFGNSQTIGPQRVVDIVAACDNLRLMGRALEKFMPRIKGTIEAHELQAAAD